MQSITRLNLHTLCLFKGRFCENTCGSHCQIRRWISVSSLWFAFMNRRWTDEPNIQKKVAKKKKERKRKNIHPILKLIKSEYLFEISSNSSQQQLSVGTSARLLVPEDRTWAGSGPTTAVRFGSGFGEFWAENQLLLAVLTAAVNQNQANLIGLITATHHVVWWWCLYCVHDRRTLKSGVCACSM